MRLLLDSHTLIWAADNPARVPTKAMSVLGHPASIRLISAGTIWEIAIKVRLGRLPLAMPYRQWIDQAIADQCLTLLDIQLDHTECLTTLPFHHRDPFDRLLAAQSLVEKIPLVSGDPVFDAYGVQRIWN